MDSGFWRLRILSFKWTPSNPALIEEIGLDRVIVSLDVKDETVATRGWLKDSGLTPLQVLNQLPKIKHLIVTDISRDGTLSKDVNTVLYQTIKEANPEIHLIAAGGISSLESIQKLEKAGCSACVIGKSFYEIKGFKEELKKVFINAN